MEARSVSCSRLAFQARDGPIRTAHGGGSRLDSRELTIGAGLDGAVMQTVAEVGSIAETGIVIRITAEFLGLGEHVVDTFALEDIMSVEVEIIGGKTPELTPHSGTPLRSCAKATAAKRKRGVVAFMLIIVKSRSTWRDFGNEG